MTPDYIEAVEKIVIFICTVGASFCFIATIAAMILLYTWVYKTVINRAIKKHRIHKTKEYVEKNGGYDE